jgi:hypothetical protein
VVFEGRCRMAPGEESPAPSLAAGG